MRLYFRWKLFFGFYGFALVVAGLLLLWERHSLPSSLLVLGALSIPPALWIASRLNRPIRLLHHAMQKVSSGNLEATVLPLKTYDEFEGLIENFNGMLAGLRELKYLQAERDRFITLSTDLICLAGDNGYFVEVNPAFERVLGYSQKEMLSRPFLDFVHPEDVAATTAEYEKLTRGAPTLSFANRYRCADGSYRWIEWSAALVPGKPLLFAIARDITDRKRMEEAERALIETRLQFRIARDIQRSLLPAAPPVLDGYDIAGASHPAEEVGGDYFDYLPMCHGRLGLVVSDATGHGIGPGLVMAATRAMLRSLAAVECSIEEILIRTNQMLIESTPDNCLVTLALSQLDPARRKLLYASCGHSTGYLLDRSGKIKAQLNSTAPPLGFLEKFPMEPVAEFSLETGDVLLMLTDGVVEAESPEQHVFGDERALEAVRANLHAPAAEIVEALHRAAREFGQSHITQDDFTSLVVKVGPAS